MANGAARRATEIDSNEGRGEIILNETFLFPNVEMSLNACD